MVETSSSGVPEQAHAAKDEAINQAGVLKETAVEHVGTLTSDAKDRASDVARDVRRELESQGDSQAKRAASMLHDVGTQLTDMASGAEPGPVQQVTRQLADKSRQVATRLDEDGVQGVGDDLRRFARRQPGLFLAAAGLAGFVVTRVAAQRAERRPRERELRRHDGRAASSPSCRRLPRHFRFGAGDGPVSSVQPPEADASLGELFADLSSDMSSLLRDDSRWRRWSSRKR